jgi:indole-3-glycerol phosphate synthase
MASIYLDRIVAHHRERARLDLRDWKSRLSENRSEGPSLIDALRSPPGSPLKVIGEIKRRSPSKGWIDENLDAAELARSFERGGAAALSVLTDEAYFAGSVDDFRAVRAASALPILRKDFTVSENDIIDAVQMGANAVLLIVAALSDIELRRFVDVAHQCGLDALVEVHDRAEARRAVEAGAGLIGVNQRDLRTFEVDAGLAASVMSSLPRDVVSVAESGLKTRDDVARAAESGFNAVLVGEALVQSSDPEALVRSFCTVPVATRA